MKDFKGTKGSWQWTILDKEYGIRAKRMISIHQSGYNHSLNDRQVNTENEDKTSIAGIWSVTEEDIANAKLITAAPEMLNLLKEMDEYLDPKFEGQINEIDSKSELHARIKDIIHNILCDNNLRHEELLKTAATFINNKGLTHFGKSTYVVCNYNDGMEPIDVFGFGGGCTQIIKVITTRMELNLDLERAYRKCPKYGIGEFRSYLCPNGLLNKEDIPKNWGLLWCDNKGKIIEILNPQKQEENKAQEAKIIKSLLRRNGINPEIFDYKKYKTEDI